MLILPFDNYTGTDTLQYMVAGIHDALIGDVGKIGALRVLSKRTAKAYQGVEKPIPTIASELNVDAAIETSISCYGENLCFKVRLISAAQEERLLWEEDFMVEKSQLSNVSKRIAKRISEQVEVPLTRVEERLLSDAKPIDPVAYEFYWRGMSYWELATEPDLELAMSYFNQAVEIDPEFALAYLGISRTWGAYAQHGFKPPAEIRPKVEYYRGKAMMLDSMLVEIRTAQANLNVWGRWNWEKAAREYSIALEINPNYPFLQAYYSHFLAIMGDPEKGLEHSRLAVQLDPFNTLYQSIHGMALKNARHYDEALDLLTKLYESEPDQGIGLPALWAVYHELGNEEKCLELARKIYELRGNRLALNALDRGYAEGGYKVAMQHIAEEMIASRDSTYFAAGQICTLYCRAEMKEEALYWLEESYRDHDSNIPYIGIDPLFDFLREEPRFIALMQKANLPQG